jgi:hypothetical protein
VEEQYGLRRVATVEAGHGYSVVAPRQTVSCASVPWIEIHGYGQFVAPRPKKLNPRTTLNFISNVN